MNHRSKRILPWAFLVYATVNLIAYSILHVSYTVENNTLGNVFAYLAYYLIPAVEFLAPPLLATMLTVIYAKCGRSKAISSALILSCARIFYVAPYYYMTFINKHYSIEALMLSLVASVLVILLTALGAMLSIQIALLALGKVEKKECLDLPKLIEEPSGTDFLAPASIPLLVFVLLRFAYELIREIADTVSFFVMYGKSYSGLDIFTILLNYVLLFAMLVLSYVICSKAKNALAKLDLGVSRENCDVTVEESVND